MAASAANKNNLIYNSEEKDGMMVGQTVYKMDSGTLANYMKYSYKYDDQNVWRKAKLWSGIAKRILGKTTSAFATPIREKYHYHLL